jgi:hypothetical protein
MAESGHLYFGESGHYYFALTAEIDFLTKDGAGHNLGTPIKGRIIWSGH